VVGRRWWFVVASLASVACGSRSELGDDGALAAAPRCDASSRCGGELFGRWRALSTCTDLGFVRAVLPCDELELREQTPMIWGYKSYSRAGRYSSNIGYSGSVRMFVPESCEDFNLGAVSCSVLREILLRRGELLLSEVTCEASDGGCTCDAALLPFEREGSGSFTARDGHLTEEFGDEGDYCVDGDTLRLGQGASGDQLIFQRD
jgi:hypothetical protein